MGFLESYRTESGERRYSQEQIDRFVGRLRRQRLALIDRTPG
jgi:hypothetical protein